MRLNKDNVINAFCIFSLVTIMCVITILVLKLFFGQKIDIGFIKDIFSIGSTLAAALIAVALFSDWKDQARHSLSKQYIEDILKIFSISKKNLRIGTSIIKDINWINEYAIFKERYKKIDFTENLNLLIEQDYKFKILVKMYKDDIQLFENFADIERHFNYLNQLFIEISLSYSTYYENLKSELESTPSVMFSTWNYNNQIRKYDALSIDQTKLIFEVHKLLNLSSGEVGFTVCKDPKVDYVYENPILMIVKCIEMIESIEIFLMSKILPKN